MKKSRTRDIPDFSAMRKPPATRAAPDPKNDARLPGDGAQHQAAGHISQVGEAGPVDGRSFVSSRSVFPTFSSLPTSSALWHSSRERHCSS